MSTTDSPHASGGRPASAVVLGSDTLTTDAAATAARNIENLDVSIDTEAAARMDASVKLRDTLIATHQPIYGVTTGFGDSARFHLSAEKAVQLQRNLITYHLNGTGPAASPEVARATMLVRANCLARGYSGIRRSVVQLLIDCLLHDITPLIPERGSVGASGDLVPLCYLADMLTGSGDVLVRGRRTSAGEALSSAGLKPVVLEAKEGLALINGTSFMSGFAVLATEDSAHLAMAADLGTALTTEALLGNRGHFHPAIHSQKPHPGQLRSAARIHTLLAGSGLSGDETAASRPDPATHAEGVIALGRAVQDPYSVRCAPHVTGVLLDTLSWVHQWLDTEINSTNDNPVFDPETGSVHNGGNFYGGHVGLAMDSLKLAVASVGDLLDRQLALLVDTRFNHGLTPNLAPRWDEDTTSAGLNHGFKGMQIAASALTAEALKLTGPATAHSRSTEAHNQDKVSMGTIAARDARTVVELVSEVAAIHLLAACQAVDLRDSAGLAEGTRAGYELIREHVPFVDRDRRMDTDVATIAGLIRSGALTEALRPHVVA
ncbi:aromatic amino acid ammonia-lyase [Streptomyces sp. NBC_00178]|uniref:HAL/PAL/TAL family ammonia-lyase n=1 Tax=Streptomyces sp. NBC_00178 TaxID=2975672 RepID=UPI002E28CB43|nr:aromatic amino acid ammonia-lyase [Streptomyces sp. NBC_00178]